MDLLWKHPGSTARDIHGFLTDREPAYTTVVTVLDRLRQKELVVREKVGRRFAYFAAMPREEFDARITRDVLEGLLQQPNRPIVNTFVDLVSEDDELLDELEALIRDKRK